jgi:serine/threonine protein kinase HipA of HipAB toxin-antitoxin module
MYDSNSFEILKVAPAYDFNSAFAEYEDTAVFYEWIMARLENFMRNNPDIKSRLKSKEFEDAIMECDLTSEQKKCVRLRAEYICMK